MKKGHTDTASHSGIDHRTEKSKSGTHRKLVKNVLPGKGGLEKIPAFLCRPGSTHYEGAHTRKFVEWIKKGKQVENMNSAQKRKITKQSADPSNPSIGNYWCGDIDISRLYIPA